ncbi:hypothetical protein Nepgr_033861 [Nepenthes gracilis]|uniref:Uncharacterized protein n=1 Tax=Nepenthes gracilis TaxID=150966 RepID=A0AAD3TM69_NEPGR|nr:hypothetical protein Nepgr_033861 [Nepenthes gracilis]
MYNGTSSVSPRLAPVAVVSNSLELDGSVPDSGPPKLDDPNAMFDPVEPASVHNIVVNVAMALMPSHGELTLHSSNEEWRDRMPSGPDLLEPDPNSAPCQSVKPACTLLTERLNAQDSPSGDVLKGSGLISKDVDSAAVGSDRLPSFLSSDVGCVDGVGLTKCQMALVWVVCAGGQSAGCVLIRMLVAGNAVSVDAENLTAVGGLAAGLTVAVDFWGATCDYNVIWVCPDFVSVLFLKGRSIWCCGCSSCQLSCAEDGPVALKAISRGTTRPVSRVLQPHPLQFQHRQSSPPQLHIRGIPNLPIMGFTRRSSSAISITATSMNYTYQDATTSADSISIRRPICLPKPIQLLQDPPSSDSRHHC